MIEARVIGITLQNCPEINSSNFHFYQFVFHCFVSYSENTVAGREIERKRTSFN
jgi:hypothetical protein